MIKVKTFTMGSSMNPLHHERLDCRINKFLEENNVEVIDIKYSTCCCINGSAVSWLPSAMLIYKELDN
jgi:hypothetical protein